MIHDRDMVVATGRHPDVFAPALRAPVIVPVHERGDDHGCVRLHGHLHAITRPLARERANLRWSFAMPPALALALPHPEDPPTVWRRFAVAMVPDARARKTLLPVLLAQPDEVLAAALPALLCRARGRARVELVCSLAEAAPRRPPAPSTVYALVGELLGSSGETRAPCVAALRCAPEPDRRAVSLALSASARVYAVRNGGEREAAALSEWRRAGGEDPLEQAEGTSLWRAWLDAREVPEGLDHALILASAGAPRAVVEQLRRMAGHLIEAGGGASHGAASLLAWLAAECTSADDLPASARNPAWRITAARALALTALRDAGPSSTLRHIAGTLEAGPLERAIALEVLRACVLAARRGPGDAADALSEELPRLTDALAAARVPDPSYAAIVSVLLGRDPAGGVLGAGRWLTEDLRARVHVVALCNAALDARRIALADLEAHGVPPSVLSALREVAREDPDPVTRQHARQLARGQHL